MPAPTQSYWQSLPHRLATYRSSFPSSGDVVIIGSGITGVNVARNLFEQAPSLKVIILDARELCGGATGRNGGHCNPCSTSSRGLLMIAAYHHWSHRAEVYGFAEAISISRFETAHPAAFRGRGRRPVGPRHSHRRHRLEPCDPPHPGGDQAGSDHPDRGRRTEYR